MGDRTFDTAGLDALWDGLDRVDSHFWHMENAGMARTPTTRQRTWWRFW